MSRRIAVGAAVAIVTCAAILAYGWARLSSPLAVPAGGAVLEVSKGRGLGDVVRELEQRRVLGDPLLLRAYARLTGADRAIMAGEYALHVGMTPLELMDRLTRGDVMSYELTIPEGWRFRDALDYILAQPKLEITLAGKGMQELVGLLELEYPHPEGLLFPDTYRYTSGMTDLDVLRLARDRMRAVLTSEWDSRSNAAVVSTPYEGLILASIVEKETGAEQDRELIAGVLSRRLTRGMLLQTDPTVIYGLGERFDGNLTRAHLAADGPYNTYRRRGLPPTPIGLPGRASLHAVFH
ncbi:MAG: endolytic transglycosylase MltG, partial [Gammaproteobacteria bacterium]